MTFIISGIASVSNEYSFASPGSYQDHLQSGDEASHVSRTSVLYYVKLLALVAG